MIGARRRASQHTMAVRLALAHLASYWLKINSGTNSFIVYLSMPQSWYFLQTLGEVTLFHKKTAYPLNKTLPFSCRDIDECMYEQDPVCSQTCSNTVGSFRCGCMTGYVLRPDGRSCKPTGESPTLLFSNRIGIRQVRQKK